MTCFVTLKDAVAPVCEVTLSFVNSASAVVWMLQSSSNAVHLRSGAPIVGIAWSHSLTKLELVQAGRWSVNAGHERRHMCGRLGGSVQRKSVFVQRHVVEEWLIRPRLLFKRQLVASATAKMIQQPSTSNLHGD